MAGPARRQIGKPGGLFSCGSHRARLEPRHRGGRPHARCAHSGTRHCQLRREV